MASEQFQKHAEILSNRVKKRFRHLSRKFRKQNVECFRLYDWDIPEVRAVVDWYAGRIVVAEYERKQTIPAWLPAMAKAVGEVLGVTPDKVFIKRRHTKTEEGPRYKKLDSKNERFIVQERNLKFLVNPSDFLDTGLFSDHRDTRGIVADLAKDKDFLNLFAYTGAFTCAAALGQAKSTTTIDRSDTYIKWAEDNMKLNGLLGVQHTFIQSDVDKYLDKAAKLGKKFDLCFVDPPSFYQDKAMGIYFDINLDHTQLLRDVFKVMAKGAIVIFSTNHQRFVPKFEGLPIKDLVELTPKTIPEDYRNRQIHRCWRIAI